MVNPAGTRTLSCGDRRLEIGARTYVMGVVNVTPDSFSDGGQFAKLDDAVDHALRLVEDGADVLDIGGESTRPGSAPVAPEEERARVLPVVEQLRKRGVRNISIDTRNARTANDCLAAGAAWINDVSALRHDAKMAAACRQAQAVVLMHARDMDDERYGNVAQEVHSFLTERVAFAVASGLERDKLVVDPGIGFGKSTEHSVALTRALEWFRSLGVVLYGPSRKRFLGALAQVEHAPLRDAATHGAIAYAALHGADIVRVHDVKGAVECLRVVDALRRDAR